MAKMDWNTYQQRAAAMEAGQQSGNGPRVGFFALKNDGDKAVVRIMHDSPEDFDLVAVHSANIDGRYRNVSCLRGPNDPMDMCPFCDAGEKTYLKIYIHLIEYTKDENNQIIATPKVWERTASYAKTLVNYMNEYGPLSDVIFTITRSGAKGSRDTTYSLMYAPPQIYREDLYVKDTTLFEGYQATGAAVLEKSYEDMLKLLDSPAGQTPANNYVAKATAQAAPRQNYSAPAPAARPTYNEVVNAAPAAVPQYEAPAAPTTQEAPARTYRQPTVPAETRPAYNAPAAVDGYQARPRRVY